MGLAPGLETDPRQNVGMHVLVLTQPEIFVSGWEPAYGQFYKLRALEEQ